jgi:hypothetical protein
MMFVLWLFLLGILGFCGWWHVTENRKLEAKWRTDLDENSAIWLTRFAWTRSLQLMAALAVASLVIIVYDWQLRNAREETASVEKLKVELDQLRTKPAAAVEKPVSPAAPAASAPAQQAAAPAYYPPTAAAPQTQPQSKIENLYNPEQQGNDAQAALDRIKKRYEDILITYYFLRKCGRVQQTDFHIITSALSQEMASVNAPGRLQNDIVTAARGSYMEMYSASSCEGQGITALYTQYINYVNTLSKNFIAE